jgi:hypothetical protein
LFYNMLYFMLIKYTMFYSMLYFMLIKYTMFYSMLYFMLIKYTMFLFLSLKEIKELSRIIGLEIRVTNMDNYLFYYDNVKKNELCKNTQKLL